MKFIKNVDKKTYENFVKSNKKSHFLQSYAWGEFCKKEKNLISHYVGLEDNNALVATALMLEKKLPLNRCYFYIPRGFILDYSDSKILKEFTDEVRNYAKKKKALFFKIDPDVIYNEEDCLGNNIINKNDDIVNNFKKLGYKHRGFTKNFETMQPRYTFRIPFDKSWEEIENNFSKTTKQRIKKAEDLFVNVRIGDKNDIKEFFNLMLITENRKDFITHNEQYYQSLYEIWNKDNSCNLFMGSVDLDKIIEKQNNTLDELNKEINLIPETNLSKSQNTKKKELEKRISKLNQDLERYTSIKKEYGSNVVLSGHFIIEYADKAWVLYAGNHNILTDTYTNYETYKQHIKYYYDKGIKTYDQFGTIGDLREDNPLMGLHEFKKKFGGNYVEFSGEYDYIVNKTLYFIFIKLVPIYRNFMKKLARKKRGE